MARGTKECNTDVLDRSKSANNSAAEEYDDDNEPSNQYLDLPRYNWLAKRCALSQNLRGAATSNEQLAWDSDFLPEAKSINDFEEPDGHHRALD